MTSAPIGSLEVDGARERGARQAPTQDGMARSSGRTDRFEPGLSEIQRCRSMVGDNSERRFGWPNKRAHDVSILITAAGADGRWRGEHPGSNISMMTMGPPQQGHGCDAACGTVSSMRSASLILLLVSAIPSSRRALAPA